MLILSNVDAGCYIGRTTMADRGLCFFGRTQPKFTFEHTRKKVLAAYAEANALLTWIQLLCMARSFENTRRSEAQFPTNRSTSRFIKCITIGDGVVGKTSLLISYTNNSFPTTGNVASRFSIVLV